MGWGEFVHFSPCIVLWITPPVVGRMALVGAFSVLWRDPWFRDDKLPHLISLTYFELSVPLSPDDGFIYVQARGPLQCFHCVIRLISNKRNHHHQESCQLRDELHMFT